MKKQLLLFFLLVTAVQTLFAQTTIGSFTPTSGPMGTSVTITGTNFAAIPTNNIVFFGATMGTVTGGTATSLTVTVNAGSTNEPISVINGTTKSVAYALRPFVNTFSPNNGRLTADDFETKVDLAGLSPKRVLIADLNGDGKPDLIVSNNGYYGNSNNSFSIFKNTATSGTITAASFGARQDYTAGSYIGELSIGDLDGDGKLDLAISGTQSNNITIYKNLSTTADIILAAGFTIGTGRQPYGLGMADIDGDGKLDLVTADQTDAQLAVYRNISVTGTLDATSFAARVGFGLANYPYHLAVGDLDGDGKADLVAPISNGFNRVAVLHNTSTVGNVSFDGAQYLDPNGSCYRATIGDIDGDGKPEIATANANSGTISIFRNTSTVGAMSFAGTQNFGASAFPIGVTIADLNGDGKPDVFSADDYTGSLVMFKNTSTVGTISLGAKVMSGLYAETVAVGDLDGDGKPDLVTANNREQNQINGTLNISILRNNPIFAPTTQATAVTFFNTQATNTGINWTNGNGSNRVVFVSATTGSPVPVNDVSYTASATFGLGTQIGTTGWYCVYKGTGTSTVIGGLTLGANYRMMVVEYTGSLTNEQYLTTSATGNPVNLPTNTIVAVPSITSFTPISAALGATVTITGSNFSSTPSNNIVFFGAVKATVTGGSTTSLTVTVPAGASFSQISVLNTDTRLVAYSTNKFYHTFSPTKGRSNSDDFTTKLNIAQSGMYRMKLSDLNGDGKPDLILGSISGNLNIYKNVGSPGVIDGNTFSAQALPISNLSVATLEIADLDGDGKPDLVIATQLGVVGILKNTSTSSTISFEPVVQFSVNNIGTSYRINLALGDLDRDGKIDIALGNNQANTILLLHNNIANDGVINASSFEITSFATSIRPQTIAMADLNNDGKLDLVAGNSGSASLLLLHNTTIPGAFNANSFSAYSLPIDTYVYDLNLSDINNDGKPEIIYSNNSAINVLQNVAADAVGFTSASFTLATTQISYNAILAVGDTDGDGSPDIISNNGSGIVIYRNITATGIEFVNNVYIANADATDDQIGIGDIDGDGRAELFTAKNAAGIATVFRNNPILAPTVQTTELNFTATTSSHTTVNWTIGNGVQRVIFAHEGNSTAPPVLNNKFYGSSSAFGNAGTQVGTSGWYCVYNGTGNTFNLTNLKELTAYQFVAMEYNGSTNNEQVLTTTETHNPATLTTPATVVPSVQASNVTATESYVTSNLNWTNGNGERKAVFMYLGTSGTAMPVNLTTYNANQVFGSGSQIGTTGWYCVYNGTGTTISVSSLQQGSTYQIMVVEYNGSNGQEIYNTATATNNPISVSTLTVPVITSFTPASGIAGSSVTITGTGFNATAANNIVSFGGANGIVTDATATSLTVTVPLGATYQPIAVTNKANRLAAYSNLPFKLTFAGKGTMSANDFDAKLDIVTGTGSPLTYGVAMGDLDGDGKLDIVVANSVASAASRISIYKNTSGIGALSGTNFTKQDLNAAVVCRYVYLSDLNGDGKPELILTSNANARILVYPNISPGDGTIVFGAAINLATSAGTNGVAIGDIDGDGRPDLVAANGGVTNISMIKNLSTTTNNITTWSFNNAISITTALTNQNVELRDLNGDGKPDLLLTPLNGTSVYIYKNISMMNANFTNNTTFDTRAVFPTGTTGALALAVGDLDNDGQNDIAIGSSTTVNYSLLKNITTITTPAAEVTLDAAAVKANATGYNPSSLVLGDLDGDGKVDLISGYGTGTANNLAVLKNTTVAGAFNTSSFANQFNIPIAGTISAIAIGDLDGDGRPDLAVANRAASNVNGLVLVRNNPVMPPTIQASNIVVSAADKTAATLSWTNGNGAFRTVFMKADNTGSAAPTDLTDYQANAVFGTGTQLGTTGWYAVYNGTGSTVNVTGLIVNTTYRVMVLEYNGVSSATAVYQMATATNNPINFTTPAIGVTSFAPTAAAAGTTVTLTGTDFTGATSVTFGGKAASFTVVSATQIDAVVALGSASGTVVITGPNGYGSKTGFTYNLTVQTINFGNLSTKVFGDANFSLSATGGSSGNAVTYTSSDQNVATVSANVVSIVGAGTSIITANQTGNADYSAATAVPQSLTVDQAAQVITFATFANKNINSVDFEPGASVNTALEITYTSSNTAVATVYQDNADGNKWKIHVVGEGNSDITAIQAGNANYNAKSLARTLTIVPVTLPITLTNYTAKLEGNKAKIAWTTASEQRNDRFEVERSTDGLNFVLMTTVKGNGTTNSAHTYTVYDLNPSNGTTYYRLKQVDEDGKMNLLGDKALSFNLSATVSAKLYPNPTSEAVNIVFANYNGTEAKVTVNNLMGATVHSETIRIVDGNSSYKLNLKQKLVPGQYIITITGKDWRTNLKLIAF